MTEAEWLECAEMGPTLAPFKKNLSGRKLRLFACACCRSISHLVEDQQFDDAIATLERYADGSAEERERVKLTHFKFDVDTGGHRNAKHHARYQIQDAARKTMKRGLMDLGVGAASVLAGVLHDPLGYQTARARQMLLLRDILGNPFRLRRFSSLWRTDTATAIAREMYESRDFGAMPILADALQDAGCDSADVLAHCRERQEGVPGEPAGGSPVSVAEHVRGCWVVDLVLGKE